MNTTILKNTLLNGIVNGLKFANVKLLLPPAPNLIAYYKCAIVITGNREKFWQINECNRIIADCMNVTGIRNERREYSGKWASQNRKIVPRSADQIVVTTLAVMQRLSYQLQ